MPDLFTRFGGHKAAAGITLRSRQIDDFRQRFQSVAAETLKPEDLRPQYQADAAVCFPELTERAIKQISSLGPFGFGNPLPIFHATNAEVAGPPKVSQSGKHLTVGFRHDGRTLFLKAWDFADRSQLFQPGAKLDILFQIEDDPGSASRGYGGWRLTLKDARQSTEAHGPAD